ncbi:hypothetical protein DMN91_005075 [Ooceraea biroi]|uniref:Protein zwilch n=1 Tax=Ooceraea biroi TaxID=2015173 RepID=A0A3L8DQW7_OOCBI|nr:protein zwilch homolog [Ooceraea biroi]RLU22797.1 hypothetical protein DMN91_005075 [Ooceraea biroi]
MDDLRSILPMTIAKVPSLFSFNSNQIEYVMQSEMERLRDVLQPHIGASEIKLSYVNELFPDLKDKPYIVLHKNVRTAQLPNYGDKCRSFDEHLTRHDVSGSPLEYSFGICEFDDTIAIAKQIWRKEEESYLPLSRTDACNALNSCLEHLDNTWSILALCDGKDSKRSRLIGAVVSEDWFTTFEAVSIGATTLDTVKDGCRSLVQEHLKRSLAQEYNLKISMLGTFDLFGTKQEVVDWDKTAKSDFEGSVNIEMRSSNLMLDPRLSKNILIAQINAGWKGSPLKDLRSQLLLLDQYLLTIDECNKNIGIQNPIKFATPYLEEDNAIAEKLSLLLSGDYNFVKSVNDARKIDYINEENTEIGVKLLERVRNVSLRHDVDFTDLLWEVLIKTSEYPQMISYIEAALKEIIEQKSMPQINDTNPTRFVKRISDLRHQETISHLLAGTVPLELVVDMGFEKLIRDYFYALRGVRFVNLHDIRQKLIDVSSGIFNTENYRKKLVTLARMHLCLECMLLIETHLKCPIESLQSLFALVYEQFVSVQSPLQDHTELCSRIFTFTATLSNTGANELSKMDPSTWRASLSSHTAAAMLTTTTYYSKMPIFPTNIYPTDADANVEKEIVHGISATSSSIKFKKM